MTKRLLTGVAVVAAVAVIAATATWAAAGKSDGRGNTPDTWQVMMNASYGTPTMGSARNRTTVRTLADAEREARQLGNTLDLRVGEVMQFSNHFYASLIARDGKGATEVLVYRNGAVQIEFGPAMMWNTEYGAMAGTGGMGSGYGGGMMGSGYGGMMGGVDALVTTGQTISAEAAVRIANRWLDENRPDLRAEDADAFPGYFTLHALRNGKVAGMLSVNAFTGDVWYHWWHGRFVAMTE